MEPNTNARQITNLCVIFLCVWKKSYNLTLVMFYITMEVKILSHSHPNQLPMSKAQNNQLSVAETEMRKL